MANESQKVIVTGQPVGDAKQTEAPMETYRLRQGARHFLGNEEVLADDEVQLTKAEFEAFGDKFEPTGKKSTQRKSKAKVDKGVESVEPITANGTQQVALPQVAAPTSHSPQDIGGKTIDPSAPKANPGNLTRGGAGAATVAGGVPVSAASLQTAVKTPEAEKGPAKDGPVKSGLPPTRDAVTATQVGGTTTPPQPADDKDKK